MTTLTHKDYIGSIEYDLDGEYLYGKIQHIDDCVVYDGSTLSELKQAFIHAVDEYIELCHELGKVPQTTHLLEHG